MIETQAKRNTTLLARSTNINLTHSLWIGKFIGVSHTYNPDIITGDCIWHAEVSRVTTVMSISMWAYFSKENHSKWPLKKEAVIVKTVFYNKTHKGKKNPTQKSNRMATVNTPNFPATTTSVTTTQKSLSVVTVEPPFPQGIITKQLHCDYSLFLKAN